MVSGADQSNELSMLDNDDGSISTDSPQGINCTIRVFQSFSAWIVHSSTPQKSGKFSSGIISLLEMFERKIFMVSQYP